MIPVFVAPQNKKLSIFGFTFSIFCYFFADFLKVAIDYQSIRGLNANDLYENVSFLAFSAATFLSINHFLLFLKKVHTLFFPKNTPTSFVNLRNLQLIKDEEVSLS